MASWNALAAAILTFHNLSVWGSQLNVYDKQMSDCGEENFHGCTYESYDVGAHEVCVTQLPRGFSMATGQGHWSAEVAGQPWCICIWAYSNYILQNKDLALKCDSIPSKVLEEQYSLDKFEQCGAMSSHHGCGAEDIRRSIQSLCQQCDAEARDASSKNALKTKCDKILAAAPAAPMSRLSVPDVSAVSRDANHGPSIWSYPLLGFVALFGAGVCMGVAVFIQSWTFPNSSRRAEFSDVFIKLDCEPQVSIAVIE